MTIRSDSFPFECSDELKDHARELNRIRREDEIRQARQHNNQTTRVIRRK